jgi:hypothetical protein
MTNIGRIKTKIPERSGAKLLRIVTNAITITMVCVCVFVKMNSIKAKDVRKSAGVTMPALLGPAALIDEMESGTIVLDIREREIFNDGKIIGATNIPLDELAMRAGPELARSPKIAVFCNYSNTCLTKEKNGLMRTPCGVAAEVLRSTVPSAEVSIIDQSLGSLSRTAIPLYGAPPR